MAAWFVMIVLLVSILLTAAANIKKPTWAAGFLVISSVCLAVIVMLAVFVMLTVFRPHFISVVKRSGECCSVTTAF